MKKINLNELKELGDSLRKAEDVKRTRKKKPKRKFKSKHERHVSIDDLYYKQKKDR